ncbi:MAG: trigger factor, partial [Deltaproteobacteria bacterium]|nr:trigger factor [Deltaproteobacteria bacterium]
MNIQVEALSPIKKQISFEIPRASYEQALDKAYQKLGKTTQIKGFRKGKVPREILEKYYGARTQMETVSHLIDESYQKALQEHQIPAVDRPQIKDLDMESLEKGEPLKFKAEVEIQPKVEAKDYEKIKIKKEKVELTQEEMERELQGIQKAFASFVPLSEGAKAEKGHRVTVNFKGTLEGELFEGGSAEGVALVLGAGRYLPDFEEGILGHQVGETFTADVKFPENYGAENLQGKTAQFEFELLELKKEELPPVDDELAKDVGKFETLEELK